MIIKKTFLAVLIFVQPVYLLSFPNIFRKKNIVKPELQNDPYPSESKRQTFQHRLARIQPIRNDEAIRTPVYMQLIGAVAQSAVRAVRVLTGRERKVRN